MSDKKIKLIKEEETSTDDLLKTMLKTMEAILPNELKNI